MPPSVMEKFKGIKMPLILVVDNDVFNVQAMKAIIENMGGSSKLQVDAAFSMAEAMKKINERNTIIHD